MKVQACSSLEPPLQSIQSRIQSRPNAFDEPRFVMTFLGVMEIFCSFRLVQEG